MCGIVGAVAQRDVDLILLEGLRRLEYRGYDSAGIAIIMDNVINRIRSVGKVAELDKRVTNEGLKGQLGIAHTRWATHGEPTENNAHPHICNKHVAVVHNGIIENYESLKKEQLEKGFRFTSDTDTEVIAHQIEYYLTQGDDLLAAVKKTTGDIEGAYAIGAIVTDEPDHLVCARKGSPLVIGIGLGENFIASDVQALLPVTQNFIYLDNGDIADITREKVTIFDVDDAVVGREVKRSELSASEVGKGNFKHYMLKEIYEQPKAITDTLEGRIISGAVPENILGPKAGELLNKINSVQIIACGTSFHAGLIAKYWFESIAGIRCDIEVASEYRYRKHVVSDGCLFVTISQSGETADTLAALMMAKDLGYIGSLAICNVPESSLIRESDLSLMTRAGPEIGVASTKAFTTQLIALMLLVIVLGKQKKLSESQEQQLCHALQTIPGITENVLDLDSEIEAFAEMISEKSHALFLGRGIEYPVALEGALKLKEISYIHAEAYPAGELKHGPLALVDADMPVIAVAPNDELLEKLKSNLEEVRARGGELFVFADEETMLDAADGAKVIGIPRVDDALSPIIYTVPLQLLAYHTAVMKGTDVDQPRNLAKSVTVE